MEKGMDIWEAMGLGIGKRMEMEEGRGDSEGAVAGASGWVLMTPRLSPRCGQASSTGACGAPSGASPRCRPARRSTTPPRARSSPAPTARPGTPAEPERGTEPPAPPAQPIARGLIQPP